jgi:Ner family transcriptional regulator
MSTYTPAIGNRKKPVPGDWHPADIVAAIWKCGTSLQRLARQNGYGVNSLNLALRRPWPKAERLIAECIGITPQAIWPSRYHPDGSPRSGRGERGLGRYKPKRITGATEVNAYVKAEQ